MSKKRFIKGTLILTCAGFLSRMIGFFYRIFLSCTIGAQGLGIYQLVLPVQTLVMAVTTSGITTAISRLAASHIALGKEKEARIYFLAGTLLAFFLSCVLAFGVFQNADFLAVQILKEPRTFSLIQLLSFSFPLSTLHSCVNSYYFAQKKTVFPSCIQLLEQIVRVGSCFLLYQIFLSEKKAITPIIAIGGSFASELAASLVSLLLISLEFQKCQFQFPTFDSLLDSLRDLLPTALPLSVNRILLTILGSIEVVLIPQRLQTFGLNIQESLSIYGIFTGMALPLILFPSALTNSASVMLMPSIAEFQALGYKKRIRYAINKTRQYCLLLGCLCSLAFYFLGKPVGLYLFHNETAGLFIQTMSFICPFLYLNAALSSILHGLGKTGCCLIFSVLGISIRICFVFFAIPLLGIRGYLNGILLSELFTTLLYNSALRKKKKEDL